MLPKKVWRLISTVLFAVTASVMANGAEFAGDEVTTKSVEQVEYTETIFVNYEPKTAAKLFTGEGEAYWVPDWSPVFIKGDGFAKNDIFLLEGVIIDTIFVVNEYDEEKGRIAYTRINEGLDVATINIDIKPKDSGSAVTVTYRVSGMGFFGNRKTDYLTADVFKEGMRMWESDIERQEPTINQWLEGDKSES